MRQSGTTSFTNTSVDFENDAVGDGKQNMSRMVGNRLSGHEAADIVHEVEEKESENTSKQGGAAHQSGDDMASVGDQEGSISDSDQSETSIRRMEGSFSKLELSSQRSARGSSAKRAGKLRSNALLAQTSFASEKPLTSDKRKLSRSIDRGH